MNDCGMQTKSHHQFNDNISFLIIECNDGHIRLMNGTEYVDGQMRGRVEVCIGNVYFTVCHDFWDALEAQVVCHYLEHDTSSMPKLNTWCEMYYYSE